MAAPTGRRFTLSWHSAPQPTGTRDGRSAPPCILEPYRGAARVNTKTRSLAWAPGGDAMVLVEGRAGGYCLDFLTPGKQMKEAGQ